MNAAGSNGSYTLGIDYVRDDRPLARDDGVLDPIVADLLDIATAAYLQDRSVRRGAPGTQHWQRCLRVAVVARQPALWRSAAVSDALLDLMHWLTEDRWSLDFVEGPAGESAVQMRLPLDRAEREVALFSGGLDATAGTALSLADGRAVLGVAVETNPQMRRYQKRVARALQDARQGDLATVAVHLARRGERPREDPTRRTRGLVFLVCGWAAARAASRRRLLVFENGVGAINLPYTRAQSGCMTSRAVHPRTLLLAERLFSVVDDHDFRVLNPHLLETKAQMCERLPEWARPAVEACESCDNAAAGRTASYRRCGRCGSCLLRRVSLHAAKRLAWDPRPYLADTEGDGADSHLPEVLWQVARLERALRDELESPGALVREFPELREVPTGAMGARSTTALLRSYVEEWRNYPHPRVRAFLADASVAA